MKVLPALSVLYHPDFLRLEQELVARVQALRESDSASAAGPAPVLILAPSQRQVLRLREVLAEQCGALLGVDVLHHQALALRLARMHPDGDPIQLAPRPLLETLVARVLEDAPELDLSGYAMKRPGAVRALAGVLRELREAGVRPQDLASTEISRSHELARILEGYESGLKQLAVAGNGGWTDRAGLVQRARESAAAQSRYHTVVQYGAYELVGMNLDLIRALAAKEQLFLIPADLDSPAWEYARNRLGKTLGAIPEILSENPRPRPFLRAARALGAESVAGDSTIGADRLRLASAQGPEAELNYVARRVLQLVTDGVPLREIAVVARTLEPYAPLAETVFNRHRLPVDASLAHPAHRYPKIRGFLLLARSLARGFERQTVMDLLRSSSFARPEDQDRGTRWPATLWDRWSRRYRIVRGESAWTEDLPRAVAGEQPRESMREDPDELKAFLDRRDDNTAAAAQLARVVAALGAEDSVWRGCRTATEHAEFLEGLGARWIHRWDSPVDRNPRTAKEEEAITGTLASVIQDLKSLDALSSARIVFTPDDVLQYLETAIGSARIPWSEPEGVRFLDVMQARGLTFSHVFLIGFNADLFPRRPRESAFLTEAIRARLRSRGFLLPLARDAGEEELLLFAQTLCAATETCTVTWQRADAAGKSRGASMFLRELARLLPGSPTMPQLVEGAVPGVKRVPTHPSEAGRWLACETGFLSLEEAATVVCHGAGMEGPDALLDFLNRAEPDRRRFLEPSLRLVETVERIEDGDLGYDAFLPDGTDWAKSFSASSLQRLGRCPQMFFFQDVLGVRPLDETAEELRLHVHELGILIHTLLEGIFKELNEAGLFAPEADAEALVPAALDALDRRWNRVVETATSRIKQRFPALWNHQARQWRKEIRAFLEKDLPRLAGHHIEGLELDWTVEVPLDGGAERAREARLHEVWPDVFSPGKPASIPVFGILDRVTRNETGGVLVSDYKTTGNLKNRVKMVDILRGHEIQVPLYELMAREQTRSPSVAAELLGIGPDFAPDRGFVGEGPTGMNKFDTFREGFEETLLVLSGLARKGRFPFNPSFRCQWCGFMQACRRYHPATANRVAAHPDYQLYFALQEKTQKKFTLSKTSLTGDEDGGRR